ncbi:hypothetical protein EVA_15154, partial [gut metagenome]
QTTRNAEVDSHIKQSKKFFRSITAGANNQWKFTFYQFENFYQSTPDADKMTADEIALQYNKEFNLKQGAEKTAQNVRDSFNSYPNTFSDFAYSLRERQVKLKGSDGKGGVYIPNDPSNKDDTIFVVNGDFEFAPRNSSYIRLEGEYYNPKEPAKRMKNDPHSQRYEKDYPLDQYPYWGAGQKPVSSKDAALLRTRTATVVYFIHLGYVGGDNYGLNAPTAQQPNTQRQSTMDFDSYQKKVNDFNVLRNHHYT